MEKYVNVETKKMNVPRYEADLYISLFYADGGDNFTDEEIDKAQSIIDENNLLSLVDVSNQQDGMVECTFITDYGKK